MLIKGNFIYAPSSDVLEVKKNKYLYVKDGMVVGLYDEIPASLKGEDVEDYKDSVIIPAFNDLHIHGPQYLNRGIGFDKELIPWLNSYTFPIEAKFSDIDFAKRSYKVFVESLKRVGTMRFVAFATLHEQAAWELMKITEESGLKAFIGKVNMDRNSSDELQESAE